MQFTNKGFSRLEAEKMMFFIPLAFGFKILKRLEVSKFPDKFLVDTTDNKKLTLNLRDQEIYVASSAIADRTFSEGFLTREVFTSVVLWSAELKAANEALRKGDAVKGGEVFMPTWFSELEAKYWLNE